MHPRWSHQGGASARWRRAAIGAAVLAAAALSLAVGTAPASAAGRYTVTATIPVGSEPNAVAVYPAIHTAYVANFGADTVSVIDAGTNAVTTTISVGNRPADVAVDPAAGTVYEERDHDSVRASYPGNAASSHHQRVQSGPGVSQPAPAPGPDIGRHETRYR